MKTAIASIYSKYTTSIVDDFDGMEQMDGFTCPPMTPRVLLQFNLLPDDQE